MQSSDACQEELLLLFDCIHPSVRGRSGADTVWRSFKTLRRILLNVINNPQDKRFRRIKSSSRSWREDVLSCYYPLRLQAWMGMELTSFGDYLELTSEVGKYSQKKQELEAVMRAWEPARLGENKNDEKDKDNITITNNNTNNNNNNTVEEELQRLLRPPPRGLLPPLQKKAWEGVKRLMRLYLLRNRLDNHTNNASSFTSGLSTVENPTTMPFPDMLERCIAAEGERIDSNVNLTKFFDSFTAELAQGINMVMLEECERVVDAAAEGEGELLFLLSAPRRRLSRGELSSSNRVQQTTITTTNNNHKDEEQEEIRRRIVERHRARYLLEARRGFLSRTGEAYRRLSLEEQRCGVALILDIAAFIEQVALVEESQTILRKDRIEARRLLNRFMRDGDLTSLHALRDEWEEKLEQVKSETGKQTVFLN